MTTRDAVRAAISNAYYEARDSGQTMEHAADSAADAVMALGVHKVDRVEALVDAWSDPEWSGRDTAAPFVRALRNALDCCSHPAKQHVGASYGNPCAHPECPCKGAAS